MQVVRNMAHVRQQKRRGKWFTLIGLLALGVAFGLVFMRDRPELIFFSYSAMMVGFVFFNLGLQTLGKWSRRPRNDQQLDKALERLSDRYTLIHFARLGKVTPEHLLVHGNGVLVLTVRELPGKVHLRGQRWRRGGNPLGRLFNYSGPQLGNPTLDNERDVRAVNAYLTELNLPAQTHGVVVFTSPAAAVEATDPTVDIVDIDGLPAYIRALSQQAPALTGKTRLAIVAALSQGEDLEQLTPRAERRRNPA